MVLDEFYKLNNGQRIPKIALGTWQTPNDVAAVAVAAAIDAGYRHIDTAIAYENESGVGLGVKMLSSQPEFIAKASLLLRKSRPK